jgi:hypothetical protein
MTSLPSDLFYTSSKLQKAAGVLAILGAITTTMMTLYWAKHTDTTSKYLGGLNWNDLVFNWHPVMMVSGMILCGVCSSLSYRLLQLPKRYSKLLHAGLHTCSITCLLIGLKAVLDSHNGKNPSHKFIANFYSLHSFIGLLAISLTFLNYFLGLTFFLVDIVRTEWKLWFKPYHTFIGVMAFFFGAMAALSGISEKCTFLNCSYSVTSTDSHFGQNYHLLPAGCRLANGIGMMVLLTVLTMAYALLGPGGGCTLYHG